MNIIKRMLRFGAAALAIAIGSQALAAPIIKESFEGTNGVGLANGTLVTNLTGWSSTGGDLSAITNMDYTGTYTATSLPLTNSVTHTNVAQLATEGGMLSFTNGAANDLVDNNLYVDAMVKFVISDSDPTASSITNDTKIAVFANSASNLVIRHMMATNAYPDVGIWSLSNVGITNSVTDKKIDPDAWYRLTIRLRNSTFKDPTGDDISSSSPRTYGEVQLNGMIITNLATAYSNTLFFSCAEVEVSDLNAVSFMGTGFIDDVVVTRDVPTFVATGSGFFYVIAESTNSVFVAYITVTAPDTWSKEYAAARSTWYTNKLDPTSAEIFALGTDNRTVTAPVPDGTQSPTNILNVLLDQLKTAGELPGQFAGMSSNDIAWIRSFGGDPSDAIYTNANSLAFEQAMKLSPYAEETVTAQITSFTVGTPSSTIVVKALTNGVAYASENGLTVNVHIDSKASLTDPWPPAAGITNPVNSFNVLGESTNTFNTPIGTFFRARILPQ